jgi:NTE family protein
MANAVVLGGGGLAGIAWEIGLLAGLEDNGVRLRGADLVVGTSAGSTVAAQLASGLPLAELMARQVEPAKQVAEIFVKIDMTEAAAMFGQDQPDAPVDRAETVRRIGRAALVADTPSEARRLEVIKARVPVDRWPTDQRILLVAVDANTGAMRVFDRESGVSLVDAVAASSAVPMVWPAVTVGEHRYMDGGLRSGENADLAAGSDTVLVLQAMELPGATDLAQQVAVLREQGSSVLVVRPDDEVVAAMGENPLDPGLRRETAVAGYRQGAAQAAEVAAFWKE